MPPNPPDLPGNSDHWPEDIQWTDHAVPLPGDVPWTDRVVPLPGNYIGRQEVEDFIRREYTAPVGPNEELTTDIGFDALIGFLTGYTSDVAVDEEMLEIYVRAFDSLPQSGAWSVRYLLPHLMTHIQEQFPQLMTDFSVQVLLRGVAGDTSVVTTPSLHEIREARRMSSILQMRLPSRETVERWAQRDITNPRQSFIRQMREHIREAHGGWPMAEPDPIEEAPDPPRERTTSELILDLVDDPDNP